MRREFISQAALFVGPELEDPPAVHALDGIEAVIDWSRIEPLLPQGAKGKGRPGYPALTLMRALLLGLMHGLSDVRLEAQLARDLAFRRFCRLEIDAGTPQASTLGRFRMALEAEGRLDAVLDEINRQLAQSGVIITQGRIAIVDATVMEAARSGREGCIPAPTRRAATG
ncbi:MAG: transposase [Marinibacterium sp.]